MGIDVSNLSEDSPLRKKIEEKLNDDTEPIQDDHLEQMQAHRAEELMEPLTDLKNKKVFHVEPMGKPRQTQQDKWKKRPVVVRYRKLCDEIRSQRKNFEMPLYNVWIKFYYPMPKSWWKAKKRRHDGRFHTQRPDLDNFYKSLLDALMDEDSIVADARISKLWCYRGKARIEILY